MNGPKTAHKFLGLTSSSGPRNLMETPRNPLSVSAYHCAAFPINSLGPQKPSTCPLAQSSCTSSSRRVSLWSPCAGSCECIRARIWECQSVTVYKALPTTWEYWSTGKLFKHIFVFCGVIILCLITCSTAHLLLCGNISSGHVVNFSHEKTWVLLNMYLYALIISDTWRYLCISWNGSSMVMVPDHSSKSQFGS